MFTAANEKIGAFKFGATLNLCMLAIAFNAPIARAQTETIRVDLKLRTGGTLSGLVVDHDKHGLVVVQQRTPFVFAWSELESGCAIGTRRKLLNFDRGGPNQLSAKDHYELGLFALSFDRVALASGEFAQAKRLDGTIGPLIKDAVEQHRRRIAERGNDLYPPGEAESTTATDAAKEPGLVERVEAELAPLADTNAAPTPSQDNRNRILEVYKTFGEKVREVLGPGVDLIESDHFLIWTDWEPRYRDQLVQWCEAMYSTLRERFQLADGEIFIAKCPVFCWRSKARFLKFARHFDGYDGTNATGYTRSIEKSGHVHVVLLRRGREEADFNRFACTLVHESIHAFVHRLYSSKLIPHWVNEGCADLIAERVLKDRCPAGENAALLARQYVRYDWPITQLLHSTGPIEIHQYAIAYSVIAYLERLGEGRLAGFVRSLKKGNAVPVALAAKFDGLTIEQLEARWRAAIRASDALAEPAATESSLLPWAVDLPSGISIDNDKN